LAGSCRAVLDEIRVRGTGYAAEDGAALDEIASEPGRRVSTWRKTGRGARSCGARQLRDAWTAPTAGPGHRKQDSAAPQNCRAPAEDQGRRLFASACWAMSPLMVSKV